MNPRELFSFLQSAIPARLPILITGAPGIGKSDIVAQAAAATESDVILSHPAVSDPTDAKGLPWVQEGRATFLPFGELQTAIDATRSTVWFLDDLGQASPAVQASYMQLLLARRVNGHKLPDCVTFIAATNRRTDKAGVSGVLEPVKSRFASIVELEPDLNSWCEWAMDTNVPAQMIAFLRFKPDLLSAFKASADLTNSPTPRTWSHAARLLALQLPDGLRSAALAGAVGEGAAAEFLAFLRLFAALPSIDAILNDADTADIPDQPATLYAVSTALASRVTIENFAMISKYVQRMTDGNLTEFAAVCVRDCIRRCPNVTKTAAFIKLCVGKYGKIVSGKV